LKISKQKLTLSAFFLLSCGCLEKLTSQPRSNSLPYNLSLDILLKNEKNDFYKTKIKDKNFDFFKKCRIKNHVFYFIGLTEEAPLGILYIVSEDGKQAYRLNSDSILNIDTKTITEPTNWLRDDEILITSVTRRTGERHIYQMLLRFKNGNVKIILTFPQKGESCNTNTEFKPSSNKTIGNLNFAYNTFFGKYYKNNMTRDIMLRSYIGNINDENIQKKIFESYNLKRIYESLYFKINKNRNIQTKGSKWIRNYFQWIFDLHKTIELLSLNDRPHSVQFTYKK
jgi:hypothetical protein